MPIQGLSRNAQFLAQIADLGFRLPHRRHRQVQLGRCHLEGTPSFATTRPRRGQTRHGALGDQLALELDQRGEDSENQFAGGRRGIDGGTMPREHLEADTASSQVMHGVD